MTRFLAFLALCLVTALRAQDSGVHVSFLAQSVPENFGQVLMASDKSRSAAFDLTTENLTQPVSAPARSFTLRKSDKDEVLATVELPAAGKHFVVLLLSSGETTYTPVAIPAKDPSFKPGDIYFFNHTDKTITGNIGSTQVNLVPAKGQTLSPQGAEDGVYNVSLNVKDDNGERTLTKTRWPVDKNMRSYVLFFFNPVKKRIDFRAVDEFVEPGKPAK